MRKYKIIGLIGPTGAGKSEVAQIFKLLDCAVVDADQLSHTTLVKDSVTLRLLCSIFGNDIVDDDGNPLRRVIAQRAFASQDNTKLLNSITHPQIYMSALSEFKKLVDNGYKYIIFDAPTLIESNGQFLCDTIITVTANIETRINRIIGRDNITYDQALARVNAQQPDDYYISHSDYVICNDGDISSLIKQVNEIFMEEQ